MIKPILCAPALVLMTLVTFMPGELRAQGASPAPLAKVTLSGDAAKRTLTKMQINADAARAIVDGCVEYSKANNQTVAVFVLAPNGDIVDAHTMDGVLPIGVETGLLKAKTVLYARSSSRAVAERFNNVDGRVIRLDLGKASGLAYYFVGGGLPIVVEDQMIGAVGQLERLRLFGVEVVGERWTARRLQEAERLASQRTLPPRRLGHPPQRSREALVGDRAGEQLQRDPALGDPVRRGLIEGDRDPPARPSRDDPGGRVLRHLAPLHHPDR